MSVDRIRMRVVLPAPLWPRNDTIAPAGTVKLTPSSTCLRIRAPRFPLRPPSGGAPAPPSGAVPALPAIG